MPSLTGSTSKLFWRLKGKANSRNKKHEKSKRRSKPKHASIEYLIQEQNWKGALKWLVQEELLRNDLPFAWSLDSCSWRNDCSSEEGSEDNILSLSCNMGAPIEIVNRIMMMYPLMIRSIGPNGMTPLHVACLKGSEDAVIESLCDEIIRVCPSNLLLCDASGRTAYDYAVESNLPTKIMDFLQQEIQETKDFLVNPDECNFKDHFPIKNIFISFSDQVDNKMATAMVA